ncbi:MAG: oligosaccharide flippase family protein [Anaerolineales bacterium]|nr:oligosaccharide flippase family protein [Anaerolineales bacterium]
MTNTGPERTPASLVSRWKTARQLQPWMRLFSGDFALKGYLSAVDQGLISITNFLASVFLARLVSPQQFGVYAVGFLLLHLVRAIQEGLVVQPMSSIGAVMDQPTFRRYASNVAMIQLALAVGLSMAAAIGGRLLTVMGNDVAGPTLFSLWFVFLTWQPQEFIRRTFYTRGELPSAILNTAVSSVVRLSALWLFAQQTTLSGQAGLRAIAWGSLAALILGLWQARRYWVLQGLNPLQAGLRNWKFGRWVLGATVANWFTLEVYPIMAAGLISFAAAGAYRALQTVVAPVHVLLRAIDTLLTPRIALLYHQAGHRGLGRALRLTYLIAGVPILGLLVFASLFPAPILQLLYGDTYLGYHQGLAIVAIFYGLWFAYWPLQTAFKAIHLTLPIFIANMAAIASMFTIGLWAIHRWGLYGTIGGQALNALIVGLVLWVSWVVVVRREREANSKSQPATR